MNMDAKWITSPIDGKEAVYTYQKQFVPAKPIERATLCASAMGVYTLHINGSRVGKGVLTPGWTSYNHRIQYQTYYVTDYLQQQNTTFF